MNLPWSRCRGQCYDSAANMTGHHTGVASQILQLKKRAIYTHYYGHSLSLAICDTIKQSKLDRNTLDKTLEISKLIKFSPKRQRIY